MTNYDNKLIEGIASLSPEAARAQLEYLVSVGERIANAENGYKIEEIDGQKYFITRNQTEPILPEKAPCPDTFYTFSLNGLVDFIEADVDGIFSDPDVRHIVSVCDVDSVKVYSPLRTFYEVEQPSSPFVLRFSENAKVALFEGDGGAWKLEAVENIKKWLRTKLYGENVHIIA